VTNGAANRLHLRRRRRHQSLTRRAEPLQLSSPVSIGLRALLGACTALACLELTLRAFVTPGSPPLPAIRSDSFDDAPIAWRQIEEGVATSHFTIHGARLTGNAPARSGHTAVILGDSYVLAEQVGDRSTMGARLEDLARENGLALDVRQYGWSGASPAQYLYVAGDVERRWQPSRVFVVVSANDFDRNALLYASPRFRVDSSGALRIVGDRITENGAPQKGSSILKIMRHRWVVLEGRMIRRAGAKSGTVHPPPVSTAAISATDSPPDSLEYARAPGAVIRALAAAYGSSLTVVYIAELGMPPEPVPDRVEALMLDACEAFGVDCISTRAAMLAASRAGHVSHGLGIAPLGNGHLNPAGHDVVARVMWSRLANPSVTAGRLEGRP